VTRPSEPTIQGKFAYSPEAVKELDRFLASRACFSVLRVKYRRVLERPNEEALRVNALLGGGLDVARMADTGDPALDRNPSGRAVPPW
jgi:hypothetical protein